MEKHLIALSLAVVLIATSALAHSGVKNPAVKARMDGMSGMGAATKVLGDMAKGNAAFDAAAAQTATRAIAVHASEIPALFKAPAQDPKSEASPKIWEAFADFTAQAEALENMALAASETASLAELRATLGQIGKNCSACHKTYRVKR